VLEAARLAPAIDVDGIPLGSCLHAAFLALGRDRAPTDLANAAMLRRAFSRGRVRRLVGTSDVRDFRLPLVLAGEAGVPRLLLAHGAYLLPQTLGGDMELGEEVALWSEAIAPPIRSRRRPIHIVGYPLSHAFQDSLAGVRGRAPTFVVLSQPWVLTTAMIDPRIVMRHYFTACSVIAARCPDAHVVLRPHPSDDLAAVAVVGERFSELDVVIDYRTEIVELLRSADVCIGAQSAATFQAALAGTSVIVLNLTGYEWAWPLGGETTVPVASSADELSRWIGRWASDRILPGAPDLLRGLGANGDDPTQRLLDILRGQRLEEPVLAEEVGNRT
jgi:hypothetical protein